MAIDIKGKWALITGSSRGIGVQIARGLAAHGCNLVLHSRHEAGTASLKQELEQSVQVACIHGELSNQDDVDRLADEARENLKDAIRLMIEPVETDQTPRNAGQLVEEVIVL